jgi:Mrp family chromosome partitioning ATPase
VNGLPGQIVTPLTDGTRRTSAARSTEVSVRGIAARVVKGRTGIERTAPQAETHIVAGPRDSFAHDAGSSAGSGAGSSAAPRRHASAAEDETRHELLKLIQRLFLPVGTSTEGVRSVMFAAPEPTRDGETTSVLAAETLAAFTGRTVCLVDANLRDPFLHRRFTVANEVGFADLLAGTHTPAAVSTQIARTLWLVPSGQRRLSAEVESGARQRAVAHLLSTFDFVLFAACSLGIRADAIDLAQSVDGVVLILDHAATRRDIARKSVEVLQAADARVSGVVLKSRGPSSFGPWRR